MLPDTARRAALGIIQIVTANGLRFGIGEGDILSFFAGVTRIGRTSITVSVEVYAERYSTQGQYVKVTEATLTYVAIDAAGRPRPIPQPAGAPGSA